MFAPATTVLANVTLLIVCAESSVRGRLEQIFATVGYRTLATADASAALSALHKEPCDLVVLDLEIEGVDGLALCRLLRSQRATSKLPIIALSDDDLESTEVDAFAAGADDYIIKPSSPGELIARVNAQLKSAQRE